MYIDDFPGTISKLPQVIMFADDSSILIATSNYDELNQISNSVLLHISKWFQVNQFVLNADKTNYSLHKVSYYSSNLTFADLILVETETNKISRFTVG